MEALKQRYDDIPETIKVPKEFIHKKGEIIILTDTESQTAVTGTKRRLIDFYGTVPDFPERSAQGQYEKRTKL